MTIETGSAEVAIAATSAASLSATIQGLKNGNVNVMSTFEGGTFADKLKVLEVMSAAEPLADHLDETILLANVVIQQIEMPDEKTGELLPVPRIILVAEDGTAYAAISSGILKSLENIFGILGQPKEWPGALEIHVSEARSRNGFRFMTVNFGKGPKSPKK